MADIFAFPIVLVVKGGQGDMSKSLLRTDKELGFQIFFISCDISLIS